MDSVPVLLYISVKDNSEDRNITDESSEILEVCTLRTCPPENAAIFEYILPSVDCLRSLKLGFASWLYRPILSN